MNSSASKREGEDVSEVTEEVEEEGRVAGETVAETKVGLFALVLAFARLSAAFVCWFSASGLESVCSGDWFGSSLGLGLLVGAAGGRGGEGLNEVVCLVILLRGVAGLCGVNRTVGVEGLCGVVGALLSTDDAFICAACRFNKGR